MRYNTNVQIARPLSTVNRLNLIIAASLLAGCISHSAPKAPQPIPDAVTQAFAEKFPEVKSAEWKRKSDNKYEAEFTRSGAEIAAKFSPAGAWLETETAIPASQVPPAVSQTVAGQFKDYRVIETQSVQRANEPRLLYELHLDNNQEIVLAALRC
jgi:hypothetical protein